MSLMRPAPLALFQNCSATATATSIPFAKSTIICAPNMQVAKIVNDLVPIESARANKFKADWTTYQPPKPSFTGLKVFDNYSIPELRKYIDWTPFFRTWELAGKFPRILQDEVVGETAQQLYNDAQAMLDCIEQENWLTAKAAIGFFPANSCWG